jgi:hypothetical protein
MEAKEKAKELVDRFNNDDEVFTGNYGWDFNAKKCALICVDEMLKAVMEVCDHPIRIQYLQQVKQEILNL